MARAARARNGRNRARRDRLSHCVPASPQCFPRLAPGSRRSDRGDRRPPSRRRSSCNSRARDPRRRRWCRHRHSAGLRLQHRGAADIVLVEGIAAAAERPLHHRRPVARRVPLGARSSDGQDAASRRAGARGRAVPQATSPMPCPAARRAPRCTPACICRTIAPAPTARRSTPATPTGRRKPRAAGYDPVLFGYTDTSLDPRELEDDDPWLRTYEGPLPGIRPLVLMGETPYPWTDWLKAKGYPVPEPIARAYSHRADGPDYEDGAAGAQAARLSGGSRRHQFPGRSLHRLHPGRRRVRSSRICRSCVRIRPSSRPSPTTRCTIPDGGAGFLAPEDAGRGSGPASLAGASALAPAISAPAPTRRSCAG